MKRNTVVNHFFNIGLGTIINVLLGLFTTPYITRAVDPSVYGQLSIFDTYSGVLLSFLYFGLDNTLIRFFYDNDSDETKGQLYKFSVLFSLISACIIFVLLLVFIKVGLIDFRFSKLMFVLLFANIISSIWQKFSSILLRLTYQSKQYSFSVVMQKIVYCLVIFIGLTFVKNYQLETLILATIISFVSTTIISFIFTKKYWDFTNLDFGLVNKRELIRYGIPMLFFALSSTLLDGVDKLFIDYYCNDYEVGLYSSAFTLISMMSLIQTTFNTAWLPIQTEQFIKNPNDTLFIRKGNKYITLITFFAGINLIMFKDVFAYLLGESYRASVAYMPFLIVACIMFTISDSTCSGIDMSKKSYLNIVVALVPCLISSILLYVLVPLFGAKGASLVRAVSAIIYFAIRTYFSNKYYYVDYDLKRFSFITLMILSLSFVTSFLQNNILAILFYIVTTISFFAIYIKDIKELLELFMHHD